jgi:hypothetical protein
MTEKVSRPPALTLHTDNGASDGDPMQFLTLLPQTIPFLIYNIYFLIRL